MKTFNVRCDHMLADHEEIMEVTADSAEEAADKMRDIGFFVYEVEEIDAEDK